MKLYLFRHGKTLSNERQEYTGFKDVSLSEQGINELLNLECENIPKGDLYISSPMKRCIETFSILYPKLEIDVFYEELKEINFGDWEGKVYSELKDDIHYTKWMNDFHNVAPPNGETYLEFRKRVLGVIEELKEKYWNKTIVVMCHGGVIRTIMHEFIDSSVGYFNWDIPNGLGYEISLSLNKKTYRSIK